MVVCRGRAAQVAPASSFCVWIPHMWALKLVLWRSLGVLSSVALAFVVDIVNLQEKMNGL